MDWLRPLTQDSLFRGLSKYRQVLFGLLVGFSFTYSSASLLKAFRGRKRTVNLPPSETLRPIELRSDEIIDGVPGLIGILINMCACVLSVDSVSGNTPLVRINSLSNALGVEILGKAEVRCPVTSTMKLDTQNNEVLKSWWKRERPGGFAR